MVDFGKIKSARHSRSQGSASYLGEGYFVTARHVVNGCDLDAIYHYPNSDISIFRKEVELDESLAVRVKNEHMFDNDYIVGFPSGEAASAKAENQR